MKAIDPVCKMEVDTETAQWTSEYNGEMYYFCAPGCKRSFDQDPEKFLSGEGGDEHHHHGDHGHHH
jgi:YHS domain-containing protein